MEDGRIHTIRDANLCQLPISGYLTISNLTLQFKWGKVSHLSAYF